MRKLRFVFLFAALGLFTTATFAQEVEEVKAVAEKVVQEKVEIQLSELPEAVTKTLSEQFAGHTAEKAYKAKKDDKDIFYIKMTKDGNKVVAVIDAEGIVIEQKEKSNQ